MKCPEDKIYNPETKRCIASSGPTAKQIVKKYKEGILQLLEEDLLKLNLKTKTPSPPKPKIQSPFKTDEKKKLKLKPKTHPMKTINNFGTINQKIQISDKLKAKIHNYVLKWKNKKYNDSYYYSSKNHKDFCTTKNLDKLDASVVSSKTSIQFVIKKMKGIFPFNSKLLNTPKQSFTHELVTGYTIDYNNYNIFNIINKTQNVVDSLYFENIIDSEWLKSMNDYIQNLSTKDLFTIIGYSHYGDVLSNNYLRQKFQKKSFLSEIYTHDKWISNYYPLFFQALDYLNTISDLNTILKDNTNPTVTISPGVINTNSLNKTEVELFNKALPLNKYLEALKTDKNISIEVKYIVFYNIGKYISFSNFWQKTLKLFIEDLNRIINNSPSIKKPTVVYRGVKDDKYMIGTQNNLYKTNGFVSTSININSALKFAGANCCLKRITLLPGTKCLLMAGISKYQDEIEILLNKDTQFYITAKEKYLYTHYDNIFETNQANKIHTKICPKATDKIKITDMVVVSTKPKSKKN